MIEKFFNDKDPDFSFIEILPRADLAIPSMNLANYVCIAFVILEFTVAVILKFDLADGIAIEHVLIQNRNSFESFTCEEHKEKE